MRLPVPPSHPLSKQVWELQDPSKELALRISSSARRDNVSLVEQLFCITHSFSPESGELPALELDPDLCGMNPGLEGLSSEWAQHEERMKLFDREWQPLIEEWNKEWSKALAAQVSQDDQIWESTSRM